MNDPNDGTTPESREPRTPKPNRTTLIVFIAVVGGLSLLVALNMN